MKPLDEYMLFTKAASNTVFVKNPQGVRSARCASFEAMNKPRPGPSLNNSFVSTCKYCIWIKCPVHFLIETMNKYLSIFFKDIKKSQQSEALYMT